MAKSPPKLSVIEELRPIEHVCEGLEEVLERVINGQTVSVAIVEVAADGAIRTHWHFSKFTLMQLVAGTQVLAKRLMDNWGQA